MVENENLGENGSPGRHVTILVIFGPLHIWATVQGRNSKFSMQNDREVPYHKKMKIWAKKGSPGGHLTILGNSETPYISRHWLEL